MEFDVLVIGSGPAGYAASIKARKRGLSVCLVEKGLIGGTCLNRGCIPAKALLHSSLLRREAAEAGWLGVHAGVVSVDFTEVHRRALDATDAIRRNQTVFLEKSGVRLERGCARIESAVDGGMKTVSVSGDGGKRTTIRARQVLIATGTLPARIPAAGAISDTDVSQCAGVFTSDDLLSGSGALFGAFREKNPALTIIGGGVIGMEFAAIYSNFGASVTVIEALPRILAAMDKEISQNLAMILKKRGVRIITDARLEKIEKSGEGTLSCFFTHGAHVPDATAPALESAVSHAVLIATGRKPDTDGLFSSDFSTGIELTGRGYIRVNECGMTNIPGIYAAGDIASGHVFGMTAGMQLAHTAAAQAERIIDHIAGKTPAPLGAIPSCVYTIPEIACAGLTVDEAKARGIPVMTGKGVFGGNGRAVIEQQERGFVKLVFHAETTSLIGAQIVCNRATDIIAWAVQCINAGITAEQIRNSVFAHPTYAETIAQAAEAAV
ncbi:MAG: NAD(P)/FAD-dependent oxidoreductase [Treponema sp.]|jgi:dihydrolipoamide dehydrogenase|nr:NAD(P)/FAD-dependent oxidoreductase [Treponema sp.]